MHRRLPYLPQIVATREQSRRRALLVSIAALTLLSISPVLGHHLARGTEVLFRGTDHIGVICLVALHVLLAPVHELSHAALIGGFGYATWDRVRAWHRARRTLAPLAAVVPRWGDVFDRAARTAGVDPRIIRVVDGLPNPAFTVGWLRPRIYLARSLADRLSAEQLAAVLAHEGAHVGRRDPLRLSVLRFFAYAIFWVPTLKRLAEDMADEAEVQADDVAAGSEPLILASAILSVAEWEQSRLQLAGTVGFTRPDILDRRIRRLAGEPPRAGTHVTRRSLLNAAAVLMLVWISGAVMAHPLGNEPATSMSPHMQMTNCTNHRGPVILHLICQGIALGSFHYRCPHMSA